MRSSSCRRIQSIGTNSNEHLGSRRVVPWRWQYGPWQALAAMAAASSGPSPLKERASSIGISNTNTIDCTFSPGFVAIFGITRAKRKGAARAPALTAKASRSPAPMFSSSSASGEAQGSHVVVLPSSYVEERGVDWVGGWKYKHNHQRHRCYRRQVQRCL
jgi:hypothetical protein